MSWPPTVGDIVCLVLSAVLAAVWIRYGLLCFFFGVC